jgi:hypothetical protein
VARYRQLLIGVYDTLTSQRIIPQSGSLWHDYLDWVRSGNVADPYVAPTPPAETLAQAKDRKILQIKTVGLARVQTRFPAITNIDIGYLIQQVMLSVIPSARALTTDLQWLQDTYVAGKNAVTSVNAATTIAQVDAVTPSWPTL